MGMQGAGTLAMTALIWTATAAHGAVITELPDGADQPMSSVNRLISGGSYEGQFGVRFGVDDAVTLRVTDSEGRAANWFFGLTSQWGFGNPREGLWSGAPAFATTGLYEGAFSITFDTPQAAFLGRFNWGGPSVLRAFDTSNTLLETVSFADLSADAPGFYGFRRSTNEIGRIEFSGYNIGIRSISTYAGVTAVPEPATWALMILGFGAVGGALRRRAPVCAHA